MKNLFALLLIIFVIYIRNIKEILLTIFWLTVAIVVFYFITEFLVWVVNKYFEVVITLTILCILAPAVYFGYKWIEDCIKNHKDKYWQKRTKEQIINLLKSIFFPLLFGFGVTGAILLLFYGSFVG